MTRTDWLLLGVVVLAVVSCLKLWSFSGSVDVLVHSRLIDTQTARSQWRETDGISLSLSTYRDMMETDEEFVARHQRAVLAMMKRLGAEPSTERIERR